MCAGKEWVSHLIERLWKDRCDASAYGPAAAYEWSAPFNDRFRCNAHARHITDRIASAVGKAANLDPEV
jgi:hypothetical protein